MHLRSQESDSTGVLVLPSPVPVPGAVHRHLRNTAVSDGCADHLARVPALTLRVGPALLELEDKPARQRVGAPATDPSKIGMALLTHTHDRIRAVGLDAP